VHVTNPEAAIRCIDDYEPRPVIFGREDEFETIVGALLGGKTALVAGGPGMGKTAVATAALFDGRVKAHFSRRRVFASLETATGASGDIARARSDHETARARFEEALALYRRIGDVMGEANCIQSLGNIASARSDHETARARFEEARALHRRIGNVVGEASCIRSLGDIARARSDHEMACARFEEALALYRRIGAVGGEAETMIRLGQVRRGTADATQGIADIEGGFALYFGIADSEDRALAGWQAMHRALICEDATEAAKHREEARSIWTAVGRLDLVHDWADQEGSLNTDNCPP
jgi:tetratricopeptide (TPR) repeat protein